MTLIAKNLATLTGGVSQQATSLRLANQCEEQLNFRASLVNGLQSRRGIKQICTVAADKGAFYPIDRDDDGRYNLIVNSSGLTVTDDEGNAQSVTYEEDALDYLEAEGEDWYNLYKVLTLADHTYILNTETVVKFTDDVYSPWKNQALVFIKQVAASTTYTLTLDGVSKSAGYGGSNSDTGLPNLYVNGVLTVNDAHMSTTDIASRLKGGTAARESYFQTADTVYNSAKTYYYYHDGTGFPSVPAGYYQITAGNATLWQSYKNNGNCYERSYTPATSGFTGFDIQQVGSVLWIRKTDGSAFTIGLADTRGDDYSYLITTQAQEFSNLPTVAPDGYIAKVIGDVGSNADDYYVMFSTDNGGTMGKGVWQECAEPGSQCTFDASTMPHILVHNADGTWTFKRQEWAEKLVGDLDSNPNPAFIDKKLRNIFLYANRMCFLTEDHLCMSAAADFENFWNETATTLTDSDPIFISASTDTVADLYDFGVQDDELIIFGGHDQYKLSSPEVLSPKTAALTSVASNAYTKGTGVVSSGSRLYFGHKKGKHYSACEFGTSAYTGSKEATVITAHVPNYIPFTETLRLCGTETTDTLTVWTADMPDSLYIYQYYISGTNKLQSAWYRYAIHGVVIKGAFYRENILWLYFAKSGTHFIATLDMAEHQQDASEPSLDLITTYTSEEGSATYTIPAWYDPDNITALTETKPGVFEIVDIVSCANGALTLDKAVTNLTIGEKYLRRYVFSTPYVSSRGQTGAQTVYVTGRWQLQTLTLHVVESGFFTVKIKPSYDADAEGYLYKYSGVTVGTQTAVVGEAPVESGEIIVPVRLRNTETIASIETDSHLPQAVIQAVWQGNYITKVRQV